MDIRTTGLSNTYPLVSGTSASTPYVAGLAALVISKRPLATNDEVARYIQENTDDLGSFRLAETIITVMGV